MRLIDGDALIPMMKYATTDSVIGVFPIKIGFNDIEKVINEQPTIEPQTDIIHCRDCKYAINSGTTDMMCNNSKGWVVATDNDFGCVFAERRTDDLQ